MCAGKVKLTIDTVPFAFVTVPSANVTERMSPVFWLHLLPVEQEAVLTAKPHAVGREQARRRSRRYWRKRRKRRRWPAHTAWASRMRKKEEEKDRLKNLRRLREKLGYK
jgi:hypothetical protein